MKKLFFIFLVSELIFAPIALAEDFTSNSFIIRNPVISADGGWNSSDNFQSFDLSGQPVIEESTSNNFKNQSGFGYIQDPIFTLTAPNNTSYTAIPISTATQITTATLNSINVINTRGVAAEWAITINVTNMTQRGASTKIFGDNDTVNFTGAYTGITAPHTYGKYTAEITTSGQVGTAIFKWTDPAGTETTGVSTASSVILNNGITINFNPSAYAVSDKWILRVDSLSYTNLTLTPGSITTNFGDSNITPGSSGTFSGIGITSNARTLLSATAGNGEGSYTQIPGLSQSVHANTLNGTFQGTITLTVS